MNVLECNNDFMVQTHCKLSTVCELNKYEICAPLHCSGLGPTYTKIGTIQRKLAWPLRKDDTRNKYMLATFRS